MDTKESKEAKDFKMYGTDDCDVCKDVKKRIHDKVEYIDILSDAGSLFLKSPEMTEIYDEVVPIPIITDAEGQICELYVNDDVILVKCGDKEDVLYERNKATSKPSSNKEEDTTPTAIKTFNTLGIENDKGKPE